MEAILTALGVAFGGVMTAAYQLEKKDSINMLTCGFLMAGTLVFWLIFWVCVYVLIGDFMARFGVTEMPLLMRLLWPREYWPYAPIAMTFFTWVMTALGLMCWVRIDDEPEEERKNRIESHKDRIVLILSRLWLVALIASAVAHVTTLFE